MHRLFRSSLLIALVALLLVRGWVGDAMAMGMAPGMHAVQQVAPELQAQEESAHDAHTSSSAVPPCHEQQASPAPQATGSTDDLHADHGGDACGSCTACQLCHSSVVALPQGQAPAAGSPQVAPASIVLSFASAEVLQGAEPPKS